MPADAHDQSPGMGMGTQYLGITQQVTAQLAKYVQAGQFDQAFQYALGQTINYDPAQGAVKGDATGLLLNPNTLASMGVNWTPQMTQAYYTSLGKVAGQIPESALLGNVGFNQQYNNGNGGSSTFNDKVTLSTDPKAYANLGAQGGVPMVENTAAYDPSFSKSGPGGVLGDIDNAFYTAFPVIGDAALVAAAAAATGGAAAAAVGGGIAGGVVGGAVGGSTATIASDAETGKNPTLGQVAGGAATGAVTGGLSSAAGGLTDSLSSTTGLSTDVSKGIVSTGIGAAAGATKGAITGTGALSGAETGAAAGAVGSLATGLTGSSTLGKVAGGLAGSAVSSSNSGSNMAASTNTGIQAENDGGTGTAVQGATQSQAVGASGQSSFAGDVLTGLSSTLGGSSLGQDLGTLLPYAGVAGIGLAQAKAGQAQDAQSANAQKGLAQPWIDQSNATLAQVNSGKLTPTDQAVVDTGIQQGQSVIASANGLSSIAQTAFSNYNSGTLNQADQITLDNQVAAQKQQVASMFAAAGLGDSTQLAAQYQQIDQQATVTKQNMLNAYFNTGSQAYNQWLTATTEGQQTIQAAQKYASTQLNTYLQNSMSEAGIGIGEMNTAITTQMTTDANYANQVSTLLGTLATAYAKQVAGQKSGTSGSNTNSTGAANATAGLAGKALGAATSSSTGINYAGYATGQGSDLADVNPNADPFLGSDINASTAGMGNEITNNELFDQGSVGSYEDWLNGW